MNSESELSDSGSKRILSAVSHDLRSPLASMQVILQNLREGDRGPLNSNQFEDLCVIQNQIYRLLHMIDNLILAADLDKNKLRMSSSAFDLGGVVRDAVQQLKSTAKAKKLTLKINGPPSLQACGQADLILQVVLNLLSNALKATPQGDIGVDITTNEKDAVVSVWDTGPGINPRTLQKAKDGPLGEEDLGPKKGFGLGLYVAQAILQKHGSALTLESQKKAGCRFSFRLPLVDKDSHHE